MKVYRIAVGISPQYAHIHAQMGQDPSKGIRVMWDDWLAKGNIIPDFVYSAYVICRQEVAVDLRQNFKGLSTFNLCWGKNPKEICAKDKSRLKWLPHEDVEMSGIYTNEEVSILPQSTVKYGISGLTGKDCIKEIIGSARVHGDDIIPRETGKGLFFDQEKVCNNDFFKPAGTFFLLCTETVKRYIQDRKYSNVLFLEVGDIVMAR